MHNKLIIYKEQLLRRDLSNVILTFISDGQRVREGRTKKEEQKSKKGSQV